MRSAELDRAVDLWELARVVTDEPVALLDNPGPPSRLGEWSYLGLFPVDQLTVAASDRGDSLGRLAGMLRTPSPAAGGPPFVSGVIGHIAYELLHELEAVPRSAAAPAPGDLLQFTRYGAMIAVNSALGVTHITGEDDPLLAAAQDLAAALPGRAELDLAPAITGSFSLAELRDCGAREVTERSDYLDDIAAARESIAAGRVFEVCLSQEFRAETAADGRDLYAELRRRNAAPMGAYTRANGTEILCTSPERLVSVHGDGTVETRPIKGTRPRSSDPAEDTRLREELACSTKDRAENTMIVDLARNDLGRVCETGSVEVPELCVVESYPSVHHLVSSVRGRLRAGTGPTEVLRACFPAGSMTGAPKVEAMKLISETERSQRGIFSGAIGWIGDDGAMDMNVVIRSIVKQGDRLSFHTGGAVTSESDPAAEYAETMDKARLLAESIAAVNARTVDQ